MCLRGVERCSFPFLSTRHHDSRLVMLFMNFVPFTPDVTIKHVLFHVRAVRRPVVVTQFCVVFPDSFQVNAVIIASIGARCGWLNEAVLFKPEDRGFDSRWGSMWIFPRLNPSGRGVDPAGLVGVKAAGACG
jgi:hypothetical protein